MSFISVRGLGPASQKSVGRALTVVVECVANGLRGVPVVEDADKPDSFVQELH